jgi:ATP-dependent DNA helicase RecQ
MLNVSGVGESKYNKYGERFIEKINQFMKDNPNAVTSEKGNGTEVDVKKVRREKDKKKKGEFYLNPEDGEKFEYKDYYNVSELRDELNRISTATDVKRVFATNIIRYLTNKGYIEERQVNGYFVKVPTEIGEEKGIISMEKVSEAGTVYSVLGYPKLIQKEIIDLFIDAKNHLQ